MATSDIIVRAEDVEFSVDRNLITKHSRYFDSLLNQPWKEHNIREINLADATPSEFQWLYEAIKICDIGNQNMIRDYFRNLDAEKLIDVHQTALYYNFPDIISYICTISVPSIVSPSNVVRLWHYFTEHYEPKIVNFLYEFLKANFSKVLNSDDIELTEEEAAKFLTAEQIGVDSETHLLAGIEKHFGMSPLLNLVNFGTLPFEVVLDVIDKLDESRRSVLLKSFFSKSAEKLDLHPHLQSKTAYCRLGFTDALDLKQIWHSDLERLDFSSSAGNNHNMDMLQQYTNLKALDFTDCKLKFEKADRSKVTIFPFMEELTFDNYTGTSLRAIPWLWETGSLRKFSARNSENLESIEIIGLCANLVKLDLRNCTKYSLNEFPKYLKLTNLEYLDVSGTRFAEDDNILFRGNIRNLTYLAMNDIAKVDRGMVMTVLRYMTRLETLEMNRLITYTTISPDKEINYFTNLKRLSCRDTLITTLFLESIWKNCKYLQHLDIRGCKHVAMDILCEMFAKFPRDLLTFKAGWGLRNNSLSSLKASLLNLERLHLSTGSTVSPNLEFIQSTKLKEFSLSFCSISPQAIERVIVTNTGLEKIQLEMNFSCEPIYSTILQGIKNCKNLTKLSLKGIHFEDDENSVMQQLAQSCTKLTSLKIFNNNNLRLSSLTPLKRLKKIALEECSSLTYEDFKSLVTSNLLLRSITLIHCFKFDREIFTYVHEHLPQLMYLTLDRCDMSEEGLMHPYNTDKSCMRMLKIHRCKKKRTMHLTSVLPSTAVTDYFV